MKRTTERADLESKQLPEYISGCRQFEGEDLNYRDRINTHASLQKQWVKEQTREHEQDAANLAKEESHYSQQTEAITRMRGILEDEGTMKKKQQLQDLKDYNLQLAQDKRDRESNWKNNQESQNAHEINRTNMSDIMTENEMTTTSQLAPHRFVPYHFKGLRKDQVDDILAQREQQTVDNKIQRQNENSEEYQWAVQNLANNQHFLNNEQILEAKEKTLMSEHRDQHLSDKVAKDERWPNMYGDLDKLPEVKKDMVGGANPRPIV